MDQTAARLFRKHFVQGHLTICVDYDLVTGNVIRDTSATSKWLNQSILYSTIVLSKLKIFQFFVLFTSLLVILAESKQTLKF